MTSSEESSHPQPDRLGAGDRIIFLLGTWFGSGLLPKAPGTWGTLAAVPLVVPLISRLTPIQYPFAVAAITLLAIPIAGRLAHLCRTHPALAALNPHRAEMIADAEFVKSVVKDAEGQQKDPGMIVIDEVAGFAAAMLFLPLSLTALASAFFFFRVFDILKIQPGRLLERLPGGVGIVLDDIAAGLYACLFSHIGFLVARLMGITTLP